MTISNIQSGQDVTILNNALELCSLYGIHVNDEMMDTPGQTAKVLRLHTSEPWVKVEMENGNEWWFPIVAVKEHEPQINKRTGKPMLKANKREITKMFGTYPVQLKTLGADPELEILDRKGGRPVSAENIEYEQITGCGGRSCDNCDRCDNCNPCDYCDGPECSGEACGHRDNCRQYCDRWDGDDCESDCIVKADYVTAQKEYTEAMKEYERAIKVYNKAIAAGEDVGEPEEPDAPCDPCADCDNDQKAETLGCDDCCGQYICDNCDSDILHDEVCDNCERCENVSGHGCPYCENCDGGHREDGCSPDIQIGIDGAGDVAELRPTPATSPLDAVQKLQELFRQVKGVPMSTIGNRYATGGHIHLGFVNVHGEKCQCAPSKQFLNILDHFLGRPSVPLNGESRGSYLEFGGHRRQSHGLEYRTCPAAIFDNPRITFLFYKIAWNVSKRYLARRQFELEFTDSGATDSELKQYAKLTDRQIAYLRSFISNWHGMTYANNDPVVNWNENRVHPLPPAKPKRVEIVFNRGDNFSNEIAARLKQTVVDGVPKSAFGIRVEFYGLKESRGLVTAGLHVDGVAQIDSPHEHAGFTFRFGLPYATRTEGVALDKVLASIATELGNIAAV